MKEYHKIQTVFLRDPETKFRTLLEGQYALPEFAYLAENKWCFTEKVDGTNIRVLISQSMSITFGGKTDDAQIPARLLAKLEDRFLPRRDELFKAFPDGGCLYGEGYGAKIQKGGGNYRQDQDFVLFDVKVGDWWLRRSSLEEIASQFSLDLVPILDFGTLPEMVEMCRKGFNSAWGPFRAEGIVARPQVELMTRNRERLITKLKAKDFA